jgi:hypothetical protein
VSDDLPPADRSKANAADATEGVRRRATGSTLRTWLMPFFILAVASIVLLAFGSQLDGGRNVINALRHPNPDAGASTLGGVGQVVTQVLGVAISVVAIIVELAANRYTHRITELFFRAPVNFVVMGFFVVSGLVPIWVAFTYTSEHAPAVATGLCMVLMSLSLLLLLPYFSYVAAFVNPLGIINRIRSETLRAIVRGPSADSVTALERVQHVAEDGAEQLADVALNAMANHDKGISMTAVNAIGELLGDYLRIKSNLVKSWFALGAEVRNNPDFISLADEALGEIGKDRTWFEFKLLRQYEMIYRAALNENRELNYLIATNIRELAEQAMDRDDKPVVDLAIKFFNTFLRATVNARDVRTAYNVLNQYRLLAESSLRRKQGRVAAAVAKYFKYYGQIAFHMDLGFILETAAYDLCALNELAFDLAAPQRPELLKIFLQVDKEGEGAKKEAALRGVRKAQVKLATYYLLRGDVSAAREVYRDMQNENPERMASIRDELLAVESPYFWEVTDRGMNFDWMAADRKERLLEFFQWFGDQLPGIRSSTVPSAPKAPPAPISGVTTSSIPAVSAEEAAAVTGGSNPPRTSGTPSGEDSAEPAPRTGSGG